MADIKAYFTKPYIDPDINLVEEIGEKVWVKREYITLKCKAGKDHTKLRYKTFYDDNETKCIFALKVRDSPQVYGLKILKDKVFDTFHEAYEPAENDYIFISSHTSFSHTIEDIFVFRTKQLPTPDNLFPNLDFQSYNPPELHHKVTTEKTFFDIELLCYVEATKLQVPYVDYYCPETGLIVFGIKEEKKLPYLWRLLAETLGELNLDSFLRDRPVDIHLLYFIKKSSELNDILSTPIFRLFRILTRLWFMVSAVGTASKAIEDIPNMAINIKEILTFCVENLGPQISRICRGTDNLQWRFFSQILCGNCHVNFLDCECNRPEYSDFDLKINWCKCCGGLLRDCSCKISDDFLKWRERMEEVFDSLVYDPRIMANIS